MLRLVPALAFATALAAAPAHARPGDSWSGDDKLHHAAVSATFGSAAARHPAAQGSLALKLAYGVVLGSLPGLLKEGLDGGAGLGMLSHRDIIANALGAAIGAIVPEYLSLHPVVHAGQITGLRLEYRITW